ncbi:glycoside hydrolase family 25 protein [Lactococcus lactis]|nr:glycoside hydrolase family 25 protein [Lactococcus lactis]MCT0449591.1 glycosyl hydrolase family 25 [Lactococcus lactis subsp. lactis]WDA67779.1 glycoside hydrolase family 25 protein [Lactococcus lactis]
MKPKMRRKLKKMGAFIFTASMIAMIALLGLVRIRPVEPPKKAATEKIVVNHILDEKVLDLNKPVVDLSGWQRPEDIDYNTLSQHVIGAVIRVNGSYGHADNSASKDGEDTAYKQHIKAFQERGIPTAVYAFVTGENTSEMRKQARDFYRRASPYKPTYYWLDVEVTNMKNMNQGIEDFRSELEKQGAKNIGIYAQDWFLRDNQIKVDKFKAIWIAAYGRNTGYWDASPETTLSYKMQQFTDQGTLPGYSGNVDLNMVNNQTNYNELFKNQK